MSRIFYWSTDKFIGCGLVAALLLSMYFGTSETIQTSIISGLVGYMGKSISTKEM